MKKRAKYAAIVSASFLAFSLCGCAAPFNGDNKIDHVVTFKTNGSSAINFVADVPVAKGGINRLSFSGNKNAKAIVVMFAGDEGNLDIARDGYVQNLAGNFLVRTHYRWTDNGFDIVLLDSPNGAPLDGYRSTSAYGAVLSKVVAYLGSFGKPIFLVGTSQGTIGAAEGGASLGDKIAGVVLTSTVTGSSASGETVFDVRLSKIKVPVLVIANRGDGCGASPPDEARSIYRDLVNSEYRTLHFFKSDYGNVNSCQAMSPHGYAGIENKVVDYISRWIDHALRMKGLT